MTAIGTLIMQRKARMMENLADFKKAEIDEVDK